MHQNPSWKANRFSASQEILHILWTPKIYYSIDKCPPTVPILCQLYQVHTPTSHFLITSHVPNLMSPFLCLYRSKLSVWVRGFTFLCFVTGCVFNGEELLAPRPIPKLEDHPLSSIRYSLFNIFAALCIEGRSAIRNLRTRHAVVTGTHLS